MNHGVLSILLVGAVSWHTVFGCCEHHEHRPAFEPQSSATLADASPCQLHHHGDFPEPVDSDGCNPQQAPSDSPCGESRCSLAVAKGESFDPSLNLKCELLSASLLESHAVTASTVCDAVLPTWRSLSSLRAHLALRILQI